MALLCIGMVFGSSTLLVPTVYQVWVLVSFTSHAGTDSGFKASPNARLLRAEASPTSFKSPNSALLGITHISRINTETESLVQ